MVHKTLPTQPFNMFNVSGLAFNIFMYRKYTTKDF